MIVLLKRQDRIDYVINRVAEFYKVNPDTFYGYHRRPEHTQRKSFLIYILHDICDINVKEIHYALKYARSVNAHGPWALLQRAREEIRHDSKFKKEYEKLASYLEIL